MEYYKSVNFTSICQSLVNYSLNMARKPVLLIVISALLFVFVYGCLKEDPCPGIPSIIDYNEPVILRLHTQAGNTVFDSLYVFDSLIILENGDTTTFKKLTVGEDTLVQLTLKRLSAAYLWSHFDSTVTSQIVFVFDSVARDTFRVEVVPVEYPEKCNQTEYASTRVLFNSQLLSETSNTTCFLCGDTLTLEINP